MPVQRVTKYPLLLSRLYKVTPSHHSDKNDIKLAQDKIEAALEQMNKVSTDRLKLPNNNWQLCTSEIFFNWREIKGVGL